jgi:hypothetical protein
MDALKTGIQELFRHPALLLVLLGGILFILAAAGGVSTGTASLPIADPTWRIAVAVMAIAILLAGMYLQLWQPERATAKATEDYGIKITQPDPRNEERVIVPFTLRGTYVTKPPDGTLRLFAVAADNSAYWPRPETIEPVPYTKNEWTCEIRTTTPPGNRYTIAVAAVDETGHALADYYFKVDNVRAREIEELQQLRAFRRKARPVQEASEPVPEESPILPIIPVDGANRNVPPFPPGIVSCGVVTVFIQENRLTSS